MYLSGEELRNFIVQYVENYRKESIQQIAYDLTIDQIYDPNERKSFDHFEVHPGDTVFIGSEEIINMPNDCIGFVSLRNSAVRFGIDYNTPVYYPGHRTRIFTRIKNESSDIIRVDKGQSLTSFMVFKLKSDVEPYRGKYKDQFEFDHVNKFESSKLPEVIRVEKASKNIEEKEASIYSNVITIMTVFIAIFSIVNLNINLLGNSISIKNVIIYNLMILTGISLLITLIGAILETRSKTRVRTLATITCILFALTILLYFIL